MRNGAFTLKTKYSTYHDVKLQVNNYSYGNNLALQLYDAYGEPLCSMTTNFGKDLPFGYSYVDTNNLPEIEEFIKEYGLGAPTGKFMQSGYCSYPLYKFNMGVLNELDNSGVAQYQIVKEKQGFEVYAEIDAYLKEHPFEEKDNIDYEKFNNSLANGRDLSEEEYYDKMAEEERKYEEEREYDEEREF